MRSALVSCAITALVVDIAASLPTEGQYQYDQHHEHHNDQHPAQPPAYRVNYDPRPFYIVNNMTDSPLKTQLQACENQEGKVTGFSIGHRGGAVLQFPEATVEATVAGARMGAGVLECDVAFTQDRGLVCRHSLCDLHTSTDILLRPELAAKCTVPFTPANATAPANVLCCTTDIMTAEYLTLCGTQDGFNASARTPKDYVSGGTPVWRTELYDTCGTLLTLDSYITLVESFPVQRNFTPELKTPPAQVPMPFNGYTQEQYARDMIEAFIARGIAPSRVWPQSFNPPDVFQWLKEYPAYGKQAVYLDEEGDTPETFETAVARLPELRAQGLNIIAPPFGYLLTTAPNPDDENSTMIVPSSYAVAAKAAGLDIIAWTFERSGPLATVKSRGEFYYSRVADAITSDGQQYEVLDILAKQVGIKGIFTDWASTVTYYANCFGLEYYTA